jgi:hypothetical protein
LEFSFSSKIPFIGENNYMKDNNYLIQNILNLSKYHREHEKYYSKAPLKQAIQIQDASLALKTLADRWTRIEPKQSKKMNPFAGCEDINEIGAIQYNGILFMEGEGEPPELKRLIRDLHALGDDFKEIGFWLESAMNASWDDSLSLLKIKELASVLGERHRIIINDWEAANLSKLVANLLYRAIELINEVNFTQKSVREDLNNVRYYLDYLYSASEILDRAADLASESAMLVHDNERRWRVFRKEISEYIMEKSSSKSPIIKEVLQKITQCSG